MAGNLGIFTNKDDPLNDCIIKLDISSINNGRVYFPRIGGAFFPTDALSPRTADDPTVREVLFRAGSHVFETSIREYSGSRLSPRKSFAPFFKEVEASEGDGLKVERVSQRKYVVSIVRQHAAP